MASNAASRRCEKQWRRQRQNCLSTVLAIVVIIEAANTSLSAAESLSLLPSDSAAKKIISQA